MLWLHLVSCKGVDPAPEDIDGLLHWLWASFDAAPDEEIVDGLANVITAVGPLEDVADGSVSSLDDAEAAIVGRTGVATDLAVGVFLQGPIACQLEAFEDVVEFKEQDELYDVYNSYERTYESNLAQWQNGKETTLDWAVEFSATVLSISYDAHLRGGLRRISEESGGPALLARTWMHEPADFNGNQTWTQDYQIEIFWPQPGGDLGHLYGLWRDVDYGTLSMQDEDLQRLMLNGLADWDKDTTKLCEENRP